MILQKNVVLPLMTYIIGLCMAANHHEKGEKKVQSSRFFCLDKYFTNVCCKKSDFFVPEKNSMPELLNFCQLFSVFMISTFFVSLSDKLKANFIGYVQHF